MKKTNKVLSVVAIGAVGVLALGASSSGADQSQSDREAAPAAQSPEATATPTGTVVKAPRGSKFSGVTVTQGGSAKCDISDKGSQLEINCRNVMQNFVGDQVFIRVPQHDFQIQLSMFHFSSKEGTMVSTLRNALYGELDQSKDDDVTWKAPDSLYDAWGVGIDGIYQPINFMATVTKV